MTDSAYLQKNFLNILLPFLNFKQLNFLFFINDIKANSNFYNYFYFYSFIVKYLQLKSNKRFFFFLRKLSFTNLLFYINDYEQLFNYLFLKFKKFQNQIGRGFFLKEFFESVFFFFFFKDSNFFGEWLKKTTERIYFKNHKKFFYFLSLFFNKYFIIFSFLYGLSGIRINISGKISLTGSAKKKSFLLRVGSFSTSKKSLKLSHYSNYIWTSQGSLGLKLFLSFN